MSAMLRDLLTQRAADAGMPDLDLDELVELGEHRLRRRRTATVWGAAAAMVLVLALTVVLVSLDGPVKRGEGPVENPRIDHPRTTPVRSLVYSDVGQGIGGNHLYVGDQVVEAGSGFVHLDVTDDGVVYAYRGGVWFSDGGTPAPIGSHVCGADPNGEFSSYSHRVVMTANVGSLAAWFECTASRARTLVIFDTASRREVVRHPLARCRSFCELVDVTAEGVYFNVGIYAGYPRPEYRLDVPTGRTHASSQREYADDLISHARGLVLGDDRRGGAATNGIGQSFRVVGSRLVPQLHTVTTRDTNAFDTATGRPLRLRLPADYRATVDGFSLFEWLDDDNVALVAGGGFDMGDVLTCRLSDGRCVVAVRAPREPLKEDPAEEIVRIVPNFPLPG